MSKMIKHSFTSNTIFLLVSFTISSVALTITIPQTTTVTTSTNTTISTNKTISTISNSNSTYSNGSTSNTTLSSTNFTTAKPPVTKPHPRTNVSLHLILPVIHPPDYTTEMARAAGIIRFVVLEKRIVPAIQKALLTMKRFLPYIDVQIPHKEMKFHECDASTGCNPLQHLFLGPACSFSLYPTTVSTYSWGDPHLSIGQLKSKRYDEKMARTTVTLGYSKTVYAKAVMNIIEHHNWTVVGLVTTVHNHEQTHDSEYLQLSLEIQRAQVSHNVTINPILTYNHHETDDEARELCYTLKNNSRIILLAMEPHDIRRIIRTFIDIDDPDVDLTEFVFISLQFYSRKNETEMPWMDTQNVTKRAEMKMAFESMIRISYKTPSSPEFSNFIKNMKQQVTVNVSDTDYGVEEIDRYLAFYHDSVLLYAMALNESLKEQGHIGNVTIENFISKMKSRTYSGISGNITFNEVGDVVGDYSMYAYNFDSDKFEIRGHYMGAESKFVVVKKINWAAGRDSPPPDKPECGFRGDECSVIKTFKFDQKEFLALVVVYIIIIILLSSIFAYRHYLFESDMNAMNWMVKWKDLCQDAKETASTTGSHDIHGSLQLSDAKKLSIRVSAPVSTSITGDSGQQEHGQHQSPNRQPDDSEFVDASAGSGGLQERKDSFRASCQLTYNREH